MRTLPVRDPAQLVEVRIEDPPGGRTGQFSSRRPNLTNPQWELLRERQQAFGDMFAWSNVGFNLTAGGEARNAQGLWVSGGFFNVLGVPALVGRVLTADDDRRGCAAPPAVLSYGFWQREYGGDPSAIGRTHHARRPRLRHRRRDAGELLRRRGRTDLRRRGAAVRRAVHARRPHRAGQTRCLVSRRDGPAEAGGDDRAGAGAARRDLAADLPGDAAARTARRTRRTTSSSSSAPSRPAPASRRCGARTSRRCGCCWRRPVWCC